MCYTAVYVVHVSFASSLFPKLTSPYFVYNVKKKCTGGEDFLVAMGYERQPNSNEFHYKGKSARELGKVVVEIVAIAEVLDMLLEESQRLKEWGKTYSLSSAFYTAFKTAMLIVGGGSFGQERATHGDSSGTAPLHSGRSGTVPSHSDRGGTTHSYGDRGGTVPSHSDRGGTVPSHSDRGGTTHSYSDRGGTVPSHSDRGVTTHSYSDRGGTAPSHSDRGGTVPSHSDRGGPTFYGRGGTVPSHSDRGGSTSYGGRHGTGELYGVERSHPYSPNCDVDMEHHLPGMQSLGHLPKLYPNKQPVPRSMEPLTTHGQDPFTNTAGVPQYVSGPSYHQGDLPQRNCHLSHLSASRDQRKGSCPAAFMQPYPHDTHGSGNIQHYSTDTKQTDMQQRSYDRQGSMNVEHTYSSVDDINRSMQGLSLSGSDDSLPPPLAVQDRQFRTHQPGKSPRIQVPSSSMQERTREDSGGIVNMYPTQPSVRVESPEVNIVPMYSQENVPSGKQAQQLKVLSSTSPRPPVPAPRRKLDPSLHYQALNIHSTALESPYSALQQPSTSGEENTYESMGNPSPQWEESARSRREQLHKAKSEESPRQHVKNYGNRGGASNRRPGPDSFPLHSPPKSSLSGEDDSTGGSTEPFSSGDYSRYGPSADENPISHI